jgi:hypothetical protein
MLESPVSFRCQPSPEATRAWRMSGGWDQAWTVSKTYSDGLKQLLTDLIQKHDLDNKSNALAVDLLP